LLGGVEDRIAVLTWFERHPQLGKSFS